MGLISSGHLYCGGLDLGFPENKTHFHGSFFEERFHTLTTRTTPPEDYTYKAIISGNPYKKANNTGTYTLTDNRLSIYIQWFEEQIQINKIDKIWNISPLGIKIEGMDYKDIKELLNYPDIREKIGFLKKNIETSSDQQNPSVANLFYREQIFLKKNLKDFQICLIKGFY